MEQRITAERSVHDKLHGIDAQRRRCIEAKCGMIGFAGCILEGELPPEAKLRLTEPCSNAVALLPHRQKQNPSH